MQRRGTAAALLVCAILVRATPPAAEAPQAGKPPARGEADFVDLAPNGAVAAPFRWRARVDGAPRPVDVLVLIDDDYFQEFPGGMPPLGGFAGAEALPAG